MQLCVNGVRDFCQKLSVQTLMFSLSCTHGTQNYHFEHIRAFPMSPKAHINRQFAKKKHVFLKHEQDVELPALS